MEISNFYVFYISEELNIKTKNLLLSFSIYRLGSLRVDQLPFTDLFIKSIFFSPSLKLLFFQSDAPHQRRQSGAPLLNQLISAPSADSAQLTPTRSSDRVDLDPQEQRDFNNGFIHYCLKMPRF